MFLHHCLSLALLSFLSPLITCASPTDQSPEIGYTVVHRPVAPSPDTWDPKEEPFPMSSSDGTQYTCYTLKLPPVEDSAPPPPLVDVDKTRFAADIVERVSAGRCFYSLTGWWQVEFCPGRWVRQYHAENDIIQSEYLLGSGPLALHSRGNLATRKLSYPDGKRTFAEQHSASHRKPPASELPLVQIGIYPSWRWVSTYTRGTTCWAEGAIRRPAGFTGAEPKDRSVEVNYLCGDKETVALSESSPCVYTLVVVMPQLCGLRPPPNRQSSGAGNTAEIACVPIDASSAVRGLVSPFYISILFVLIFRFCDIRMCWGERLHIASSVVRLLHLSEEWYYRFKSRSSDRETPLRCIV